MKKLNLLLTISLVSLFISMILIIAGNKNNYCLSFGFIFLAVSLALFVADRTVNISKQIEQNKRYLEEAMENQEEIPMVYEVKAETKKLGKTRASFIMGAVLFCLLLVILAFNVIV